MLKSSAGRSGRGSVVVLLLMMTVSAAPAVQRTVLTELWTIDT